MDDKVKSGIAWTCVALLWLLLFSPALLDILYAVGVSITWAEADLVEYLPSLFMGFLAIRDFHKGKVF